MSGAGGRSALAVAESECRNAGRRRYRRREEKSPCAPEARPGNRRESARDAVGEAKKEAGDEERCERERDLEAEPDEKRGLDRSREVKVPAVNEALEKLLGDKAERREESEGPGRRSWTRATAEGRCGPQRERDERKRDAEREEDGPVPEVAVAALLEQMLTDVRVGCDEPVGECVAGQGADRHDRNRQEPGQP
jgi:hypothetical protein